MTHDGHPTPFFESDYLSADPVGEFGKTALVGTIGGLAIKGSLAFWNGIKFRAAAGDILKGGATIGGFAGLFQGLQIVSAKIRHKDDIFNAPISGFITGLLVGMRSGNAYRMAYTSSALALGALAIAKIEQEYNRVKAMDRDERRKDMLEGAYKVQPDIYAERWERLKARGLAE
ncbi:hypothetical protein HDU96_004835 [Phlyctochytrium bullatum]|nr:hypothetical protein HDU96_004835 [Phlyctochytrium bullatum]